MKDMEKLLKSILEEEVEARSSDIPETIMPHSRPFSPFWRESAKLLGAAACVTGLVFSMSTRKPSALDEAISNSFPSPEAFAGIIEKGAAFVEIALVERNKP